MHPLLISFTSSYNLNLYTIGLDVLSFYNLTVSFGENIVKFKISDRYLFRGDLFIEKST